MSMRRQGDSTAVRSRQTGAAPASPAGTGGVERGFTLTEVTLAAVLIALLVAIAVPSWRNGVERARLARCMAELRGIQAAIWADSNDGKRFMQPAEFWASHFNGRKPGPYHYLLDGDPNKGHGNDLDGIDEENPGKSSENRDKNDIRFVVLCQHDHKFLADYVYLTDAEPPAIVGGPEAGVDPRYERFIKYEFGGPGGGDDKDK
jgi:prepilin-type N-terminal cleavage/methylation domain-containing protein